ncbi:hypothetical protein TSUD_300660 [Trifolium subterraneum]|uniref:RING-CH-type domain-containing protein n=1 Tax=Trifolium subterraneum TaxID=3900 RepID=A0A2Z6PC78_TRISU|nr:hypothetical protein TSUD_300660 [Trifolium subterraneum]
MADHLESSPLVPPIPLSDPSSIDLEAGPSEQIQCRICLETDGRDFIAPCKCKGTSKYVHRECLDHWRSVKEGFAFAHCTTCKAPYHLRVHVAADRKWRTLKFRFFVTRDILSIFLAVQLELFCFLPCLAFLGASLLVMIEEFAMIWPNLVENYVFVAVNLEFVLTVICQALFVCGLIALHALRVVEPWQQSVVVVWECIGGNHGRPTDMATSLSHTCKKDVNKDMADSEWPANSYPNSDSLLQISPTHYVRAAICDKIANASFGLTMEYVVEDVDGEMTGSDWSPPALPPEHIQQLKTLGLL